MRYRYRILYFILIWTSFTFQINFRLMFHWFGTCFRALLSTCLSCHPLTSLFFFIVVPGISLKHKILLCFNRFLFAEISVYLRSVLQKEGHFQGALRLLRQVSESPELGECLFTVYRNFISWYTGYYRTVAVQGWGMRAGKKPVPVMGEKGGKELIIYVLSFSYNFCIRLKLGTQSTGTLLVV